MLSVLHAWAKAASLQGVHRHDTIWEISTSCSIVLALCDLHFTNHRRRHLRVLLRGMGKHIQAAFLYRSYGHRSWTVFISYLHCSVWSKSTMHLTSVYDVWMCHQKVCYVGKVNHTRTWELLNGVCIRYREHFQMTFKPPEASQRERKYDVWANGDMCDMCMLPFVWTNEHCFLKYKRFLVNHYKRPFKTDASQNTTE